MSLQDNKSLTVIHSSEEFLNAVTMYSDESIKEKASEANKNYELSRTGASAKFYQTFLKQ